MFKLSQSATFRWPVEWEIPGDGRPEKVAFVAEFHRLPQSEVDKLAAADPPLQNAAIARRVMAGWDKVTGEDGAPVPFNSLALEQLLEVNGAAFAIAVAFFDAVSGAARRKN